MNLSVISAIMAVFFFFSAAVQLNDPDPIQWIAIYAAAGVVCTLDVFRPARYPWIVPGLVGAAAAVWAGYIASGAQGAVSIGELFGAWEMKNTAVEEHREIVGLLMVAIWMIVLAVTARRRQRPRAGIASG